MKKILIVVSHIHGGGAEHVARKNLECIIEHPGFEAALMTCGLPADFDYSIPVCNFNLKGSKVSTTLGSGAVKKKATTFLFCYKPDIIHIHNYLPFTPSLISALQAYKARYPVKIVMTHHSYSYICTNDSLFNYAVMHTCEKCIGRLDTTIIRENCANNKILSTAKYIQKGLSKKHLYSLVDFHISPSEFLRSAFLTANPALAIKKIYNPCIDLTERDYPPPENKTILYFGRISKEKNILDLTRIFLGMQSDYTLHIIGTGPLAGQLKKVLAGDTSQRVVFTNHFLNTADLSCLLARTRYFILPSVWYENSPVSIVEGINWGAVPIVSYIGGMKELCDLFDVGIGFDVNDESSITNALHSLDEQYNDQKMRLTVCRDKLGLFTVESYRTEITNLYHTLLKCAQ